MDLSLFATLLRFMGIEYASYEQEFGKYPTGGYFSGYGLHGVRVPLLYLFLAFAIMPAIWFRRLRRERRKHKQGCPSCGYNLTGNTSGICPECGTRIAQRQSHEQPG